MLPLASSSLTPDYGDELWALPALESVSVHIPHLSEMLTTIMMQGIRRTKVRDVEQILKRRFDFKPTL